MTELNRSRLFLFVSLAAVLGYMVLVYWLSDMPSIVMDVQTSIAGLLKRDVFEHCLEFIPLGILSANLVSLSVQTRPRRTLTILILGSTISALYGVFDELHQSLVPNRIWEMENAMFDVGGDAIGAVVGVVLFLTAYYIYSRRALRRKESRNH